MRHSKMQEVVIIGGGPAGSTAAAFLAMKGHRVTVLEKERFPREHVGESLLPFCYGILQELGVVDQLTGRFVRKPGVRFIDVDGSHSTTWCFGHVIKDPSFLSFHVFRDQFDQILLDNARSKGATVREQTRVTSVDLDGPDGTATVEAVGPRGGKHAYRARFVLDASGRDTFLASRNQWKRPHEELDRAALSTHWTGARFVDGIEEGLLQIVYLGGEKKGWIWVIPIGPERLSVGVVLNHDYIRGQKRRLARGDREDWQMALYRQELGSSDFVMGILESAEIAQPLMVNGDYSYTVQEKYGRNFALIGDASTFIDPIFASGVFLSMNSARLVSDGLSRQLRAGAGQGNGYLDEAYGKINGAYGLIDKAIRLFYNPAAVNFAQVGSAARLIHQHHEDALALAHYLLAGDFFERHEEYSSFIDLLQSRELFGKYRRLVMDRPEFQSTSCGVTRTEVFHQLLEQSVSRPEVAS